MKKFFTLLVLAACCAAMTWGCSDDKYDDTEIRQEIENLKQEIASMKEQVNSLKTIIDALNENKFITNYTEAADGSCTITFNDGNMNYERLLSLSPDIVLLFGVSGASAMEPKLRELGIPYAYMGEYLEQSPLGKAEWLVAVAEIAGMRERGEEVFREIPLRYDSLKTLAAKAERKPVVMLNTPYGDSWLMAPPSSYVARLIADAGGQYVYTQDTGNQSRPIDTEEAYRLAEMSDCWINVGSAASLKELAEIVPKFMDTRPVREGRVYNNNRRTNPSGGNDYWESGVIHPDLILQDLIRIFHPELTDAEPTYYRKLN